MTKVLATSEATSTTMDSRLGFSATGNSNWPEWDRFLTVDGKKAYHLGNICGTCEFLFERLEGAVHKISPKQLSAHLKRGVTAIEEDIVRTAVEALPAGDYKVCLLSCVPRLVVPSKPGDYFFEEQIKLWGVDGFWGVPHYTKTEYYRTETVKMPGKRGLFEFVIPMFPSNHLNADAIKSYEAMMSGGGVPTALAISILDVKQPANWDGDPDINEHWCLSHYLLDGHHKTHVAQKLGKPLSILSFLAIGRGVCSSEQIAELIETLEAQ